MCRIRIRLKILSSGGSSLDVHFLDEGLLHQLVEEVDRDQVEQTCNRDRHWPLKGQCHKKWICLIKEVSVLDKQIKMYLFLHK